MANIVNNTTYSTPTQVPKINPLRAMSLVSTGLDKLLPNRKAVNLSGYSGIVNNVRNFATPNTNVANSTPAVVGASPLGTITTPYGGQTRFESFHKGVDIANKIGTPIPADVSGVVTDVERGYQQGSKGDGGFGNSVIITDSQGNQHRYSHLLGAYVMVGQPIQKGQVFAAMGNSGQTYSLSGGTGSHLDYRIKDLYGRYVNPTPYISNL